jgi:hypothetical protein
VAATIGAGVPTRRGTDDGAVPNSAKISLLAAAEVCFGDLRVLAGYGLRSDAHHRGHPRRGNAAPRRSGVAVGALGVGFGDNGTRPIYTVQTVFNPSDPHPVAVSTDTVYGIISLIFWSATIIVSLTYVSLIMRAPTTAAKAASWR